MPNYMNILGYHIFFWSNEGEPLEPVHVHVSKNVSSNSTKIWICSDGNIEVTNNNSNIPDSDFKKIKKTISQYADDIVNKWSSYFKQEPDFFDLEQGNQRDDL